MKVNYDKHEKDDEKDDQKFAIHYSFICDTSDLADHNVEVLKRLGCSAYRLGDRKVIVVQKSNTTRGCFQGFLFFSDDGGKRLADAGEKCVLVKVYDGNSPFPTIMRQPPGNEPIVGICDYGAYLEYCCPSLQTGCNDHQTPCQEIGGPVIDLDLIAKAMNGDQGDGQQRIAEEGAAWVALLLRKNSDYGSSAWKAPVLAPECDSDAAMRVRMSDKIERICSLLPKGDPEVSSESLEDTIRDLGAYCLLWLTRPK